MPRIKFILILAWAFLFLTHVVVAEPTPQGMIWIPTGEFVMGSDEPYAMSNEKPAHRVEVKGFWLDEHPVTNAQFRKFVDATGYKTTAEIAPDWEQLKKQAPPGTEKPADELLQPGSLVFTPPPGQVPLEDMSNWWSWTIGANWKHPQGPKSTIEGKDNHPVVQISWFDAQAYATWAGKRLPTEEEWEYAARGGSKGTRYYWGDQLFMKGKYMANSFTGDFPYRNTVEDGYERIAPVKSFPKNGFGLFDMAGNVWNWTADNYRADKHEYGARGEAHPPGCFNPTRQIPDAEERVIKGGSFLCSPSYCESYRPSARRGTPPDTGSEHIGFRCAK